MEYLAGNGKKDDICPYADMRDEEGRKPGCFSPQFQVILSSIKRRFPTMGRSSIGNLGRKKIPQLFIVPGVKDGQATEKETCLKQQSM
jgi:hypothetical protein